MKGLLLLAVGLTAGCGCGRIDITGETDASDEEVTDTSIPDLEPEEPSPECGNGIIEEDEACDGGALGGMTCEDLGHDGGTLSCAPDCRYDESLCGDLPECIRYVDINTTALSPDGLSWATAVPTVQHGIELAADVATEEEPCEVWVAEGRYFIYQSDHHDTVHLRPHVHLYGGFDGTEELRVERDWEVHETILDGHSSTGEHIVYHVVTGSDYSVIDGCTITGGKAVGGSGYHHSGGGILNVEVSPSVRNCKIEKNQAGHEGYSGVGGGVYNWQASPRFEKCRFSDNRAYGGSGYGGAISSWEGGSLEVVNCEFVNNRGKFGGAIYSGNPVRVSVSNSTFYNNQADDHGGAMLVVGESSELSVANAVFLENTAGSTGGGLDLRRSSTAITNCSFSGNVVGYSGGAIYLTNSASLIVQNCLLWGDEPHEIEAFEGAGYSIYYTLASGGYSGVGVIDSNPLFVDPETDLHLQPGSPCIDSAQGDLAPLTDADGAPRYDDPDTPNTGVGSPGYVDMGAFEYMP
jgi:predicted outer membrane repeat protein